MIRPRRSNGERRPNRHAAKLMDWGRLEARDVLTASAAIAPSAILAGLRPEAGDRDPATALPSDWVADSSMLMNGIWKISLERPELAEMAAQALRADPDAVFVEPDQELRIQAQDLGSPTEVSNPNDPLYSLQWNLERIAAPQAWPAAASAQPVIVAVIDSGVDYRHPDLASRIWVNPGEIAGNGIDDDGDGFTDDVHGYDFLNDDADPMDDSGHGTHAAGIIAAVANNGVGVAGIAANVQIMPLKFLNANNFGSVSDAIRAINYAVAHGATISNHSWGSSQYSVALESAIRQAGQQGHIVVAAAGNSNQNIDVQPVYPASLPVDNVVSVTAIGRRDRRSAFANVGQRGVDLAAPGLDIVSLGLNGQYMLDSGTSSAAPHVTAALAILKGLRPEWTPQQLIAQVLATVDPVPIFAPLTVTGGVLNLANAIASLDDPTPPSPPPPSPPASGAGTLKIGARALLDADGRIISSSSNGSVQTVRLYFNRPVDPSSFTADDVRFSDPSGRTPRVLSVQPASGVAGPSTVYDIRLPILTTAGAHRLEIEPTIRDAFGGWLDQNNNGQGGEFPDDRYVATFDVDADDLPPPSPPPPPPPPPTVARTRVFRADPQAAIPDMGSIVSAIVVTEDFNVDDLNVRVSLTHPMDVDLVAVLRSPTGRATTLFNRRGGTGDDYQGTLFDDQAPQGIHEGQAPFAGSFRPESPLRIFGSDDPRGVWTLTVHDLRTGEVGELRSWSLEFSTFADPQTAESSSSPTSEANPTTITNSTAMSFLSIGIIDETNLTAGSKRKLGSTRSE